MGEAGTAAFGKNHMHCTKEQALKAELCQVK